MTLNDWTNISRAKAARPSAAHIPLRGPPAYTPAAGPPRLRILGATWGGVQVTQDIRDMVSATQTMTLDMGSIHNVLKPDPAYGTVKTLSVLYTYEGHDDIYLVNLSEKHRLPLEISATAHECPDESRQKYRIKTLEQPFWRAMRYGGEGVEVELLAVLYGPVRIERPSVLEELSKFFEGRRGQIRMTNSFFKEDTWPDHRKSWAVYFRFVGSDRIQVVTGMEDCALEIPWSRY
ncbi:hypothetical protein VPNG_00623 [Cytospora leucostoma]|uniref:Uncharacterized protein n=1 Tax=Cytospora leucostoma TaxID=1230097 RepID=A0A423XNV3_9PEZI|nr:hypothetical protein VPNG_00623 [Cytospora leucostoma]